VTTTAAAPRSPPWERPRSFALPAASGVLLAAAAPPSPSPLVPFVALVPLALWVATLAAGPRGALAAAGGGLVAGAIQHGWGLRWLPGTLGAVAGGGVGWAGSIAVIAALAACTAAATCGLHALLNARRPAPIAAALPLAWTTLEWGLAHLPFGWAFPWAPLGLGLARWPESLGLAELVGVRGVTAWLATVSGVAAAALLRARAPHGGRRSLAIGASALAAALLPVAGGALRARSIDAPVVGRAAAVALRVPRGGSPVTRAEVGAEQAERALGDLPAGSVDLIALPEMLLPLDPASAGARFRARLAAAAAAAGAPLLVGALGVDGRGEHNSAVLLHGGPEPGAAAFRADKRRLVPGVERASAVRASWLAPSSSGYSPGEGWPVARVAGGGGGTVAVGALICFEAAFSEDARRLVLGGARAFAVLSSDAWFGGPVDEPMGASFGDSSDTRTARRGAARRAGIAQQTAHLTMRVVETRTGAVRASNGGPALLLAPTGRAAAATDSGAVSGPLRAARRPTVYARTGDLAGPAATLVLLALLLLA
jgi:apolipoprotein N-acyltransferase